jgi:uncharacterized protein DUF6781
MATETTSQERIRAEAQDAVRAGGDVRERIRALTLRMLSRQPLESGQIRAVVRAMTEGIAEGAPRAADVRQAVSEGFRGLDEALTKSAEAARLAVQELASKGRQLSETTLRQGLDDLGRMEEDFLSTIDEVAGRTQEQVKSALTDLVTHARRAGTDSGRKAAEAASTLSASMGSLATDSARFGMEAAREAGARFTEMVSGMLAGMADAIAPQPRKPAAPAKAKPKRKSKPKAKAKAKSRGKARPRAKPKTKARKRR